VARRNNNEIRVNQQIRADEVRLIDQDGENHGVVDREEALEEARVADTDLLEIAPDADPPVTKIKDYGEYKYEQQKKEKRQKTKSTETKVVQVKIGTDEHDLELKAKRASEWLNEGHRVKLELYLRGRAKGLGRDFHKERMERFLKFVTEEYTVTKGPKKESKGLYMILQSDS
jgi:translation initiation factor IF-3